MGAGKITTGLKQMARPRGAMRPDKIATGLLLATALRLTEMSRPARQRILEDDFGRDFLPPAFRVFLWPGLRHLLLALTSARGPGAMGMLLCRTRYIDEALRAALVEGAEQVVNLGAGMDTRAFRIRGIERTGVFEVDQAPPMAWKAARLAQVLGGPPPHLSLVGMDFDRQDLGAELEAAGFRAGLKTFVIWEGVTQYLTPEAVDAVFRYLSRTCGPGSQIAFTYLRRGIIDGSDRSEADARFFEVARSGGAPWVNGYVPEEMPGYLAARGFELIEQGTAESFGRAYYEAAGRKPQPIYDGEWMALARVVPT